MSLVKNNFKKFFEKPDGIVSASSFYYEKNN